MDKWTKLWFSFAINASTMSKDPITKVGSVIVSKDNRQCSIGYNGFPAGVLETPERWERPEKYDWVIHSEENNLLNCPFSTIGCKMYLTHKPCHKCLLKIVQAGITHVYYLNDYDSKKPEVIEELSKFVHLEKVFFNV